MYKFDFFPADLDAFSQSELARKRYIVCAIPGMESVEFPISSPEDTILAKLVWFHEGGEASDRHWHDILGVLKVQAGLLEHSYMQEWAGRLRVADLLQTALDSKPKA